MTVTRTTHTPAEAPAGRAPTPRDRRRKPRKVVVPLVVTAAITGAAVLGVTRPWERQESGAARPPVEHGTVAVQKGSLSSGIQIAGTLGYDEPTPVVAAGRGTVTALPAVGDVVKPGGKLYEADGTAVVLMRGSRPLWRDLGPGTGNGPDVQQLKRNLVDLGYADGLGLAVDEKFTQGTGIAIKRWQKSLGVRQTGTVALGSVVMLPQESVRVQQLGVQLGAPLGSASIMTVSGTGLVVTVRPADNQLSRFKPAGRVEVRLSDGGTVTGRVRSLIRGGSAGQGEGDSGGDGDRQKTTVTVALDSQSQARKTGPSSVTVTVVGDSVSDALIVPVTALLALDGGGYGVKVVDGTGTRLVKVRLGLIADAQAQISGSVQPGTQVVVPK
ncbi:peptidoglycan-binding protein [Streptomyces sp. MBT42]|uniref:peptidoglycan-binding protein n=1 Tax=Streptomyces sp. MBT42 TaxID=1488373 RepID=UPI001E5AB604|nr:peptidoglycan-binding protein [Streptomyces sp. MBT42]MCD2469359.1 peptidoglycan-binding protein [Streptomyces sp. MBT42]